MGKNKPVRFRLRIDIQCGSCGSLSHLDPSRLSEPAREASRPPKGEAPPPPVFPRFCACCGAGLERFCLKCHRRADMFFEEWWPEDDECLRTYGPAKRCSRCNAVLEMGEARGTGAEPA